MSAPIIESSVSPSAGVDPLEAQIQDVKNSGSLIRIEAPLLQHWPWENGIALEHGSMTQYLKEALNGRGEQDDIVELVLVMSFPSTISF
jgi:hypothetical protein